jgi:multidrug efflux pump subunit AcrA (membrane-fusion protein)
VGRGSRAPDNPAANTCEVEIVRTKRRIEQIGCAFIAAMFFAGSGWTAEIAQTMSLATAQAVHSGEVTATGRALPQYEARIASRLGGAILEWGKNEQGQALDVGMAVKTGQLLFRVDPSTYKAKVDTAEATLASAQAALDNLVAPARKERIDVLRAAVNELDARVKDRERDEARYRQLAEVDKTVPIKRLEEVRLDVATVRILRQAAQARLDEAVTGPTQTEIAMAEARVKETKMMLASAQLDLRDTAVTAPFDAVITKRMKSVGDYVASGPVVDVLELTTVDRLEADLRLPETYLPRVIAGETRVVLQSPLMKCSLDLPVSRIVPQVDEQRGTFTFRVTVPPDQRCGLVGGAFVTATLKFADGGSSVIVPQRAIIMDAGKSYVMIAAEGKMQRRPVELGDRLTEGILVKSGLNAGDQVVFGPQDQLVDGAVLPDYLVGKKQ